MELAAVTTLALYTLWMTIKTIFMEEKDRNHYISIGIFFVVTSILSIYPFSYHLFQYKLEEAGKKLIDGKEVRVKCQTFTEDFIGYSAHGWVYHGDNKVFMTYDICSRLKRALKNPKIANMDDLFGLHVFTHEVMHGGGEYDEFRTDCKAYQRNHRTAQLLGMSWGESVRAAIYLHKNRDPNFVGYYSPECKPGGALDEYLDDAVWILNE
jgi:hypothetical protein